MDVSAVKNQVQGLLDNRRQSGGVATGGSFGTDQSKGNRLYPIAMTGAVIGLAGWTLFLRPAQTVVTPADTGNAQIDQAMQMLQQQQDINRDLLKGQQELSAHIVQTQNKAKTVQPSINCFLTVVCPGTGNQETATEEYAIVGEGIRTARVDPSTVLPQLTQPVQPAPAMAPSPLPETYSQVQQVSAPTPDTAELEYRRLSEALVSNPKQFYNEAWQWQPNINGSEPIPVALRRIFAEIPQSRPY